ncbi:MAG TPA: PKD domain-containing protein [Rubrivivax sp.]|nr:PKD domain-containing protein [Rubrivivax sp.]
MHSISRHIATAIAAAALAACGGGSSSVGSALDNGAAGGPAVLTGVFADSPVAGMAYSTPTQSGKTGSRGEFLYLAGENIVFAIGNVRLPAVPANATLTPLDIARTTDINHPMVSNILVLLQSLDEDGNPDNGITIPAAAAAQAATSIDFDVSTQAFTGNAAVLSLVANSGSANKTLIAESAARSHFQDTLNGKGSTAKINVAPTAQAGAAQSTLAGRAVTLDGSGSTDANNDALTYAWTLTGKPEGSLAKLDAPNVVKPMFLADVAGTYTASLVVSDGALSSTPSLTTITVSVANAAPVASAGVNQSVIVGNRVMLSGAASSDANGDSLSYAWTLVTRPAGSSASLSDAATVGANFTPDVAGTYVAALVVNDGKINSSESRTTITAALANVAPVASAGSAQNAVIGGAVVLDGSGSTDANGDPLTYAWTLSSRPAGSTATLTSPGTVKPGFTPDVAGSFVATLVVSDGKLSSAPATVTVTATAAATNVAPVAQAGAAQNAVLGARVTLDGSGSSDANGDALSYAWTLSAKPAGSKASLTGATTATPSFVADQVGSYVSSLIVSDGRLSSTARTVTVTASGTPSAKFNMVQTLTDGAQGTTMAFSGLALMTGNLAAQSFFPPGKVADYTGFQYLRDNDPDNMGHNTSFLTRVANNVIYILTDSQLAQLSALAAAQQAQFDTYGYKRYPLMQAFRRLIDGQIPAGSTGLNLNAVTKASRELYLIDGQISFDRALLYANIIGSLGASQKAYLASMKGKGWSSWPDITDAQIASKMAALAHGSKVAVMTYASDIYSWYAGSLEADVYFCPERHGTYYGGFYIKDAPAVGHEGYSIDEQMTATAGAALIDSSKGYVTASQASSMYSLVATQKTNLNGIVTVRTQIATLLRSLLTAPAGAEAVKAQVLALSAIYGELDGANNHRCASTFALVYQTLSADQKTKLTALRKSLLSGRYADGTAFDFSTATTPFLYSAVLSSAQVAPYISDAVTNSLFFEP